MFKSVATIDLSQDDETASKAIYEAFTQVGFAYIINHGVPEELMQRVEKKSSEFFNLPEDIKNRVVKMHFLPSNTNVYRGFFPVQYDADSWKEGFEIGEETIERYVPKSSIEQVLCERNYWPKTDDPEWDKEFRSTILEASDKTRQVADRIMRLLAMAFGVEETYFERFFKDSVSTYRLLHYPFNDNKNKSEMSCTAHFDSTVLTVLHQDSFGGLQVENDAGEWIDVPYVKGSYVLNIGRTLEKWTGMKLRATKHRVLAIQGERWSVPLFLEPNPSVEISPMPATKNNEGMVPFEPFTYGEFLKTYLVKFSEYIDQHGFDD